MFIVLPQGHGFFRLLHAIKGGMMTWLVRLAGLLFLSFTAVASAELPEEPMLRIDGGIHTGLIRRLDVSADGKILVTGSEDKTVRVWSLPEGRLLRTLRLPVAPGDVGKVFAVAISPDGMLVAGGADYEKDGSISTAELNLWLTTQVKKLTGNRQNAVMLKPDAVPDFSIARLKQ